jgi:DNA ligase 1
LLFHDYAITAQAIGQELKTGEKVRLVADLLRRAESDDDLYTIAVWFSHGPFPPTERRTLSVGGSLERVAYARLAGEQSDRTGTLDYEIFVACRTMTGSTTDAVEMLLEAHLRLGQEIVRSEGLRVAQVQEIYNSLADTSSTAGKLEIIVNTWRAMSPLEIGFFMKTMSRSMRIGMTGTLFEQGIALAFERPIDDIRYVAMVEGNAGTTALRARRGELERTEIRPFRPLDFMLATALERAMDEEGRIRFVHDPTVPIQEYLCEDKLDGVRAQAHIRRNEGGAGPNRVILYSRSQGDLTASFPDVAAALARLPHGLVLDGELVALGADGGVAHFNNLQQRLGVKKPAARHLGEYPAGFVGYDVLVENDTPVLDEPLELRRERLEALAGAHGLPITTQRGVGSWEDVEREFDAARARGNEGLVLKRRGSLYEYGKRGKTWLKAKKEGGSIDAVIRYATGGNGRRSGTLSDFTFGVWLGEPGGERRLVNIGKAYGGYTNEELAELNRQLLPLRGKRFGATYEIEPRIVCELVYDFIQRNTRTEAGYTLRFPRIRRIRWDLGPDDVDTVEDVERLYLEDLNRAEASSEGVYVPGGNDEI